MTNQSYRTATVSLHYLRSIQQTLKRLGVNSPLVQNYLSNQKEENYYYNRIEIEPLLSIWQEAEQLTSNSQIGLLVGKNLHPSDLGLLGQLVMNCDTVASALLNMYGIEFIVNNLFPTQALLKNGQAINRLQTNHYEAELIRPIVEQDIAGIINLGPFLFNGEYQEQNRPVAVHFRHQQRGELAFYQDVLQCEVKFNQPYNQIIFPLEILQTPIYGHDKRVYKAVKLEVDELVKQMEETDALTLRLWRYFQTIRCSQDIAMEACATAFRMTSRTLQRNLKAENTSFQSELFAYKEQQAKRLLFDNKRPLKDIALELGFSDSSGFHKAFKRWSGQSPNEYRDSLQEK